MSHENEGTPERVKAVEIQIVDRAESAASKNDGRTALNCLKKVGAWTLDIAEKIGVDLVVEAIIKRVTI